MKDFKTFRLAGFRTSVALSALAAVSLSSVAYAADAPADKEDAKKDEIVVTGTLIRGTTVVGAQTITVDAKAIAAKAASSTNELLTAIPQISNAFNGRIEGDPRGISAGISITKPNLRNLPSNNTSSGSNTLVLVDGMRLTGVGVHEASVDPDIVPAAVIAGIDVVTDGGSSLYGADAVAGVLNFRTMKTFDGIKIDGNYGFGDTISKYKVWDGAITVGKSWSTGGAYISAGHSERDNVTNGDTPWSNGLVYTAAGVGSYNYTQCNSPVGTETRWKHYAPGVNNWTSNPLASGAGVFAVGTACDATSAKSYLPQQKRSNVYVSLSQELGDNLDLRITGYWTKRDTELTDYAQGFTAAGSTLTTGALVGGVYGDPAVNTIVAIPAGTGFSFGPNAAYVNKNTKLGFETWGVTPEVTAKLSGDWQVRATGHFGRSTSYQSFAGVDTVKAQCYITGCTGIAAGQLNPLNVAAASAAVVTDITNYENAQQTKQQMAMVRVIADGSLFALPGGNAKLAVGAEYQDNKADTHLATGTVGLISTIPYLSASRNSKSVFAELSLPVASFLDLNASVRYDSYSDSAGSTTNPNVGFAFKPTDWLKIYGHWNTSFNAPTAIDDLAIATGRYVCGIYTALSTDPTKRPTDPLGRDTSKQGSCAFVMQGSSPNLKPQTADSWAVGFEVKPSTGLRMGGEFYAIDFQNVLGSLDPSKTSTYTTNPTLYTYNASAAEFAAFLATLTNGTALATQHVASDIAIIVDTRTTNLNSAKVEGVDFHVNFDTDADFGHVSMGTAGTVITRNKVSKLGVVSNDLGSGSPRFSSTTFVGWNNSTLSAKATVNYSGDYHDNATNNLGLVEAVRPFIVTNLAFGYNFAEGMLAGSSLRLNIDNLFERTPQTIRRTNTNNATYNNWTLGRVIKLGFSAKF